MAIPFPKKLRHIGVEAWNAMSSEEKIQMCKDNGIQTSEDMKIPAKQVKPQSAKPKETVQPTPAKKIEEVSVTPTTKGSGIRSWVDPVVTKGGQIIMGSRIRVCVLYQIEVRKDPWYTMNLTKGFILNKADKLDADTPEDADLFVGDNPLLGLKKIRTEDYETVVSKLLRDPKDEEERQIIKNKFGVTPDTIPYLAKKDCVKCEGSGKYSTSSYPGDPLRERLTETIECSCSYE